MYRLIFAGVGCRRMMMSKIFHNARGASKNMPNRFRGLNDPAAALTGLSLDDLKRLADGLIGQSSSRLK
jgi:hypothetical protein